MIMILPGWNSIDSVSRWHKGFEIAGFTALGLLLLFEVLAYFYGNRKDGLLAVQETAAREERQKQQESSDRETTEKINAAQGALQEARNAQTEAERKIAALGPRVLTTEQRHAITATLHPYGGHRITITKLGDAEAGAFADQIIGVFTEAKWQIQRNFVGLMAPPVYGVMCRVSSRPDAAAKAAISSFQAANIRLAVESAEAEPDYIELFIGLKPPN